MGLATNNAPMSWNSIALRSIDLPSWLSIFLVLCVSVSIPLSVAMFSSNYLTSETGYADGGDMYSHITEALHVKEQLEQGNTDLWYDGVTLGYPILMGYQPLPCLFTATTMIATQRYISPLRAFRWLFVALLTLMPLSWFYCCQKLGMSHLESSMVVMKLFSLHSWVDFGLELSAFRVYGLYTQSYGMLMLPLTVGSLYKYILYNEGSRDVAIAVLSLNFLSHCIFGIYVVVFTITMVTSDALVQIIRDRRTNDFREVLTRALEVHGISWVISGWWLVPTLHCYRYLGGLPWKYDVTNQHSFDIVLRKLLSGEVYDFESAVPFTTLGTLAGIFYICIGHQSVYVPPDVDSKNVLRSSQVDDKPIEVSRLNGIRTIDKPHHHEATDGLEMETARRRQVFHVWLVLSFSVSFILFLGRGTFGTFYDMIPFHGEMESLRYLNALHFCGLLLFGVGTSFALVNISRFVSQLSGFTVNQVVVMATLIGATICLSNQSQRIANHFTVSETNDQSMRRIRMLKEHPIIGRLYGHKEFETSGPWEFSFLPYQTGKPGIHTYSRGYHDSLTVYYLESFQPIIKITPWFPDLLRLFNIRYIMAKNIPAEFIENSKLSRLFQIDDDVTVYIRSPSQVHGYFEFVNIPGTIQGDLKGIRDTVVGLTQIFQVRALLAINSEDDFNNTAQVIVTPVATPISAYEPLSILVHYFGRPEKYLTQWIWHGRNVSEHDFLDRLMWSYQERPIKSAILKETVRTNSYSAIVTVPDDAYSKDTYSSEHLLLKVTYHPFWSCRYAPPSMILTNSEPKQEYTNEEYDKWKEVEVQHVIPNLMSITLPPGRHEVVCLYSNPWYQKLGLLLFIFIILLIFLKEIYLRISRELTRN